MKLVYNLSILLLIMIVACSKPSNQSDEGSDEGEDNPTQALYDQAMNIHDEVMPKMEDIYKIKSQIQEKIANSPNLVKERKETLERTILQLDSANNAMMDWMHEFNPLPDSVDEEEARAYFENQIEKIKKVKELMVSTIEQAKEEASKN